LSAALAGLLQEEVALTYALVTWAYLPVNRVTGETALGALLNGFVTMKTSYPSARNETKPLLRAEADTFAQ